MRISTLQGELDGVAQNDDIPDVLQRHRRSASYFSYMRTMCTANNVCLFYV